MISPKATWEKWEAIRISNRETTEMAANMTARRFPVIQSPDEISETCFMDEDFWLNSTANAYGLTRSEIEWAVVSGDIQWRQLHWNQNEANLRGDIRRIEARRWIPAIETLPTWEEWRKKTAITTY